MTKFEPPRDKTNKVSVRPAKTRISLGIHPVWSESLLSAWRKLGSLATHWAHSEDSDQTGQMPSLISVFAVRMKKAWILSYPLSTQQRLWWDWADLRFSLGAQSLCWFCHVAAQIVVLWHNLLEHSGTIIRTMWFDKYVPVRGPFKEDIQNSYHFEFFVLKQAREMFAWRIISVFHHFV